MAWNRLVWAVVIGMPVAAMIGASVVTGEEVVPAAQREQALAILDTFQVRPDR